MERKGTKLLKLQEEMFRECRDAETYHESFRHLSSDHDFLIKQLAVAEELLYLISMMGWTEDYREFCEANPSQYKRQ